MKAVLISIRPKWVEKIANGEKTIEVRKTRPKLDAPFKCYIYCTQSGVALGAWGKHGKVIGEFTCDRITRVNICGFWDDAGKQLDNQLKEACLTSEELCDCLGTQVGYGWHISDLKIYDTPKDLSEFVCRSSTLERAKVRDGLPWKWSGMKRPPQSWCYVEEG